MNKNKIALFGSLDRLILRLLTITLVLGFGISNIHAQVENHPNFYNQVDGALTNVVTVAPGDTINFLVGINSEGAVSSVAVAMNFDPNVIQIQNAAIIDESDPAFNFQSNDQADNLAGNFTFVKFALGTNFTGSAGFMSVNLIISDQITESTTTSINHILDASAELPSRITISGNIPLADHDAPSLLINIQVGPPDCELLGNNIGAACEDGNPLTFNDIVTENCECIGTPGPAPCYPPQLTLAIQDADSSSITCLLPGEEYYILATLSGGEGNDTYTLISTNQEGFDEIADANSSVVLGPFIQGIGNGVIISATGNQNPDCVVEKLIWIPAICIPANNNCTTPIPLVCGEPMIGTTVGATASNLNPPYCAPTGPSKDVFYTLTVTAGQEYTISVVGPTYDAILLIYRGASCTNPLLIVCKDEGVEGEPESRTFVANLNETLKIRTYDRNGSQTAFTITAQCQPFDCPVIPANIGDPCDDNNPLTTFDTITADCECVGTPYECIDLMANIGDTCDDGNEMTINDQITQDCTCAGVTPPDGMFCWAPIEVPSLPYTTTDNTENYGNNYGAADLAPFASTAPGYLNGNFLNGNDAVYAYTPAEDGFIDISVTNHATSTGLFVFTGCPFDSTLGGSHNSSSTAVLSVQLLPVFSGITYYIIISTKLPRTITPYTLTITPIFYDCPTIQANFGDACDDGDPDTMNDALGLDCLCAGTPPPAGVSCEDPILITSIPFLTTDSTDLYGDNYGMSDFPPLAPDAIGSPTSSYLLGNDVVYAYTPAIDGAIDIKVTNQGYHTGLFVFKGCPFTSTLGGRTVPYPNIDLILQQFPVIAGETYYIVISSLTEAQTTNFTLSITESVYDCPELEAYFGAPCDDGNPLTGHDVLNENCECVGEFGFTCASAIPLECNAGPITYSSVNSNAVKPPNTSYPIGSKGLYFSFIATGTYITIYTSASFTHAITIRHGTCESSYERSYNSDTGQSIQRIPTNMVGDMYYVYVAEYLNLGTTTGDITIDFQCAPHPENDDCENAIPLTCGDVVQGTTVNASNSGVGLPGCIPNDENQDYSSQQDVFYSLDVIQGVDYTVSVNGDDYDAILAIYNGLCGDLSEIQCSPNSFSDGIANTITFTAQASETLIIRTYEYNFFGDDFTISVSCNGNGPVYCSELEAYVGDTCNDGNPDTDSDYVDDDCTCKGYSSVTCQFFEYYLADHDPVTGISDIYYVDLTEGIATMQYLTTSDIEVHIAFQKNENLLYAISKHENSYRIYNPMGGFWGPTIPLGGDYGEIVFASQNQNAIYSLNLLNNLVSTYDTYSPISGGDIAFTSDGMLYMATRSGNGLYQVWPADVMPDVLLGSLPAKVTGLAATYSDQLLISAQGMTSLELYNTDGTTASTSYSLQLNGAPYTLRDGDLASACIYSWVIDDCLFPITFYVNHGPDISGSDLYKVQFTDGQANLTYIQTVPFEAHIGYNAEEFLLYLVNKDGSIIRVYDVLTNTYIGDLPILGDVDQITAVEYNPIDGLLYVADANSNEIASIDLNTGIASYYANAPVYGGDIAFIYETMYLANRSTNKLYEIVPFGEAILIGSIPEGVNGMANSKNYTNFITSSATEQAFIEINPADGSTIATYTPMFNGNPFTIANGDMSYGCSNAIEDPTPPANPIQGTLQSQLTAYPNPTTGQSEVVFHTAQTSTTLVEVYDMRGRNIATLFNRESSQGQEYRLDFDGSYLPNGIYIYRLTTLNETVIEKFVIAR